MIFESKILNLNLFFIIKKHADVGALNLEIEQTYSLYFFLLLKIMFQNMDTKVTAQ